MREPPKIINYIEIDGEQVLFDSLPEERRKEISQKLLDNFMGAVGFKRKTRLRAAWMDKQGGEHIGNCGVQSGGNP